ncbi:MAG TPA: hypothetical protein PLY80_02715 [Pseudomonadota bacterium]|jgi:hypothetical protein|nr:hypothetical protein [Pseudomonadota bacterium]
MASFLCGPRRHDDTPFDLGIPVQSLPDSVDRALLADKGVFPREHGKTPNLQAESIRFPSLRFLGNAMGLDLFGLGMWSVAWWLR